jgi:lipopolysaccharide/colanic/teichoic acid biosynthesis glycosyltransferase
MLLENNNCQPINDQSKRVPLGSGPGPGFVRATPHGWYARFKPMLDSCLAIVLLMLLVPLMAMIALLIKLTSRGPVFYTQTRLGRHGRHYTLYKFRTMIHNCERLTGPQWTRPDDPRITAFGRILRRTHCDELPQLWNVLKGEMSLVGPRPERPEFLESLENAIPRYRERLQIRPGLTGLAQVQLPPDTDIDSVRRKLAYDLHYLENLGPWMDFRILLSTGCYVLGIPLAIYRRLCRLPPAQSIKPMYQTLSAKMQSPHRSEVA